MSNVVVMRVGLTAAFVPLAAQRLVASFSLLPGSTNSQVVVVSDGKGGTADLRPGGEFRFAQVNLAELSVKGKAGEEVFVVGNTA